MLIGRRAYRYVSLGCAYSGLELVAIHALILGGTSHDGVLS